MEKEAATERIRVVKKKWTKNPVKDQVVDMENQVVSRGLLFPAINTKEALRVPGASLGDQESILEATQLPIL